MASKAVNALTAFLVLTLAVAVILQVGPLSTPQTASGFSTATVTLQDQNGTTLATVSVRVANNRSERYTGLSTTESLERGEGMLFVHPAPGAYGYVMRDMAFPLDIVFVAANGTVTEIHHAPTEPGESGDELTTYRGRGKYVLEVPRDYTNATGLAVGDRVVIPGEIEAEDGSGFF